MKHQGNNSVQAEGPQKEIKKENWNGEGKETFLSSLNIKEDTRKRALVCNSDKNRVLRKPT